MATTCLWLHNRGRFLTATTANTTTKFGWIDKCRNHNRDQGNHPTWQPQMMKPIAGTVVELKSKDDFDAFLKEATSTLVVVDFYADWCGPCKMIAPQIEAFAKEFSGKVYFAKVNVDKNEEVAKKEGITAMPTFKLYKNGQKVNELTGANEDKLKKLIEDNK